MQDRQFSSVIITLMMTRRMTKERWARKWT
jgi:hypothetical protein